jgi:histidinol-phosphate/aromatic aminotransferase/cobyric acid decarboxylase-like protein
MNTFKAITTVYSYYMPEIRELITDLTREYPHDVFLRSISPGLDDFHHPIIEKLVAAHARDAPHLAQFAHRYPTAGSEEGIRETMTLLQSSGVERIYMWEGDYEGYRETARTRNIATVEVEYDGDPAVLPPGHWFLSNPSARNGMIVPPQKIQAILEAGHKVFYDLSYLGATGPAMFDLGHPNVVAAAISFSKPYGLFYYRVGFTFCREPIPALYANKWFKNVYGLLVAERILDRIDQAELARKYKAIQLDIVERVNRAFELGLSASDAFLLAKLPATAAAQLLPEQRETIDKFRRGEWYRFCLTPYFEEYERGR